MILDSDKVKHFLEIPLISNHINMNRFFLFKKFNINNFEFFKKKIKRNESQIENSFQIKHYPFI